LFSYTSDVQGWLLKARIRDRQGQKDNAIEALKTALDLSRTSQKDLEQCHMLQQEIMKSSAVPSASASAKPSSKTPKKPSKTPKPSSSSRSTDRPPVMVSESENEDDDEAEEVEEKEAEEEEEEEAETDEEKAEQDYDREWLKNATKGKIDQILSKRQTSSTGSHMQSSPAKPTHAMLARQQQKEAEDRKKQQRLEEQERRRQQRARRQEEDSDVVDPQIRAMRAQRQLEQELRLQEYEAQCGIAIVGRCARRQCERFSRRVPDNQQWTRVLCSEKVRGAYL